MTHDATRLVDHDEITFAVLVEYLDRFRRDRRLVAMNDIFDAIPIAHEGIRLGNIAVDGSDARLERISLRNGTRRLSSVSLGKQKAKE